MTDPNTSFPDEGTTQQQHKSNAWRREKRRQFEQSGRPERWIQKRLKGMDERNQFTSTLAQHGVRDRGPGRNGFARCTDATYRGALGRGAQALRVERGLRRQDTIRDYMTTDELDTVEYAEDLAGETYVRRRRSGARADDVLADLERSMR